MMENISYLLMSITCFVLHMHTLKVMFRWFIVIIKENKQENLMSYSKTMGVGMLMCGLGV